MNTDIRNVPLLRSGHLPGEGLTIMEMVATVVGEPPSNQPLCSSPVLARWMQAWADALDDSARHSLRVYVGSLADSHEPLSVEAARQWLIVDWVVRVLAPIWLQCAGLHDRASRLVGLPKIASLQDLAVARTVAADCAAAAQSAAAAQWRTFGDAVEVATGPVTAGSWRAPTGATPPRGAGTARDLPEPWGALAHATAKAAEQAVTMVGPATQATGYADATPAELPPAWRASTAAVAHSASAIACSGIRTLMSDPG